LCGALLTFTTLWGTPFLVQQHGMTTKEASYVIAAMLLAFSVGSIAFGRLSDAWHQRKSPMLMGGILMVLGFGVLATYPGTSTPLLIAALIIAAFGSGSMVVGFAFAKESVPPTLAGTATGVHNMGVMMGTLIQLPLLGVILDGHWRGAMSNGVRQYDLLAFKLAFTALFLWIVCSVLSLLLARETSAKPFDERALEPREW
jgi:MFS family permease